MKLIPHKIMQLKTTKDKKHENSTTHLVFVWFEFYLFLEFNMVIYHGKFDSHQLIIQLFE